MILILFLVLPLTLGFISLFINNKNLNILFNLLGVSSLLFILLFLYMQNDQSLVEQEFYLASWQMPWIASWGVNFDFRLDNLSFIMLTLTQILGALGLFNSYYQVKEKKTAFYFLYMIILMAVNGIFLSFDLFLFFIFWEIMIIPIYFLTLLYGGQKKESASTIFLLMTQISGLCLFSGIMLLAYKSSSSGQDISFNYDKFFYLDMDFSFQLLIASLFLVAFLVKLAIFPFHNWLYKLFAFAPSSALFVGVFIKTGAYGIIRFFMPIFPDVAYFLSPMLLFLGIFTIFFGSLSAFFKKDAQKVLAYLSISHAGLILSGLFCQDEKGLIGALILIIGQSLSLACFFLLLSILKTQNVFMDIFHQKGLLKSRPMLAGFLLFFTFAFLGLPGLGSFVGEYLILMALFSTYGLLSLIPMVGLLFSVVLGLWLIYHLVFGKSIEPNDSTIKDLSFFEKSLFGLAALLILGLGIYPKPIFNLVDTEIFNQAEYLDDGN